MSKSCLKKNSKKPKSKIRKIISWVITSIFGVLMVCAIGIQIMGLVSKNDNFGVPNYFGKQVLIVLTDSMEPEYPVGSAVIVEKIPMEEYKIEDDITFVQMIKGNPIVITHRCSNIETPSESPDGLYYFETHGINTHSNQCQGVAGQFEDCTHQTQRFSENEVLGKVVGCSVFLGGFLTFLTSPWGLLFILLVPTLYLIVSSVIDIFKAVKDPEDDKNKKDDDHKDGGGNNPPGDNALKGLSKEDKERLKQEMLEEMLAKGKGNA